MPVCALSYLWQAGARAKAGSKLHGQTPKIKPLCPNPAQKGEGEVADMADLGQSSEGPSLPKVEPPQKAVDNLGQSSESSSLPKAEPLQRVDMANGGQFSEINSCAA